MRGQVARSCKHLRDVCHDVSHTVPGFSASMSYLPSIAEAVTAVFSSCVRNTVPALHPTGAVSHPLIACVLEQRWKTSASKPQVVLTPGLIIPQILHWSGTPHHCTTDPEIIREGLASGLESRMANVPVIGCTGAGIIGPEAHSGKTQTWLSSLPNNQDEQALSAGLVHVPCGAAHMYALQVNGVRVMDTKTGEEWATVLTKQFATGLLHLPDHNPKIAVLLAAGDGESALPSVMHTLESVLPNMQMTGERLREKDIHREERKRGREREGEGERETEKREGGRGRDRERETRSCRERERERERGH
jgi:hypothetical protein